MLSICFVIPLYCYYSCVFTPPLFSGRPPILPPPTLLCSTTSWTSVPLLPSFKASSTPTVYRSLVRGSSDVSSIASCAGKWCCLLCSSSVIFICFCFCFIGQPHTMQEYVRVRIQSPAYIGYSPADDLFVEFEGWATLCRIASVGCSLTRCMPPLEI